MPLGCYGMILGIPYTSLWQEYSQKGVKSIELAQLKSACILIMKNSMKGHKK